MKIAMSKANERLEPYPVGDADTLLCDVDVTQCSAADNEAMHAVHPPIGMYMVTEPRILHHGVGCAIHGGQ